VVAASRRAGAQTNIHSSERISPTIPTIIRMSPTTWMSTSLGFQVTA
jgi:dihydroxyacid dehydratase/phosphogluconate dehydratase